MTGDVADADDLLQSAIERLLQRDIGTDQDISAYAFTVCKNLWIDEVRKRRVRRSEEFNESNHLDLGAVSSQEELIEINQLINAVSQLPEKSRDVLSLVAIGGLSYAEAADQLGVPVGTVMSRISRARSALTDQLNAQSPMGGGDHAIH